MQTAFLQCSQSTKYNIPEDAMQEPRAGGRMFARWSHAREYAPTGLKFGNIQRQELTRPCPRTRYAAFGRFRVWMRPGCIHDEIVRQCVRRMQKVKLIVPYAFCVYVPFICAREALCGRVDK